MFEPTNRHHFRRWLSSIGWLLTAAAATAQQPAPAAAPTPAAAAAAPPAAAAAPSEPLPAASEIIARHVAALGGEAAIRHHQHVTWKGTFALPGMGIDGTLVMQASAPNLFHLVVDAPGIGTITQGYDGKVGWSDNPMTGPTLTQGPELEQLAIESDFYTDLDYAKHYPKIEVVGRETFGGELCYKVALTTPGGIETFQYFSIASGLLVGVSGDLPTPMGDVFVETVIGGYKEFDGRLYPTENRQKAMGSEQVLTLKEADFAAIDPSVFALPEAIKTLASAPPKP